MAETSMNLLIHGAVRRDLDRFVGALSTFRDGDAERARGLHTAWLHFEEELTDHHHGEHEVAWPALAAVGLSADTLTTMDAEHDVMATALGGAGGAMSALTASPDAAHATAALEAMQHLREVTIAHLDHEEQVVEPVFRDQADSEPVQEMSRRFRKRAGLSGAGRLFAWISDGASPEHERALREMVPGPVLAVLVGVFGRRYRREVAPVWR